MAFPASLLRRLSNALELAGFQEHDIHRLLDSDLAAFKRVMDGKAEIHALTSCSSVAVLEPVPTPITQLSLLEFLKSLEIPASTEQFCAQDHFRVSIHSRAVAKISYLGKYFQRWLLRKIEGPFPGGSFFCYKLQQGSVDDSILAKLGGVQKAEVTLWEVYWLMTQQPQGEDGILLNNGLTNIFYVRDQDGVLRAVGVSWSSGGWRISAYFLESLGRWCTGDQIFSRSLADRVDNSA